MWVDLPAEGRKRVVILDVEPAVDAGYRPAKAEAGLPIAVRARLLADGHDLLRAWCRWEHPDGQRGEPLPLAPTGNDWWERSDTWTATGLYRLQVGGAVDPLATWQRGVEALYRAGTLTSVDVAVGLVLIEAALPSLDDAPRDVLRAWVTRLSDPDLERAAQAARDPALLVLANGLLPARFPTESDWYPVQVDPLRARFSAWYECFPRSTAAEPGRAGTFADLTARLSYIGGLGFDVLYLPPIHPIGLVERKGPDNSLHAGPGDPGSPWAIGSEAGGHTAIHPELGTLQDFRRLLRAARENGLEVALDMAFQCAPDHPWVTAHPEWFKKRPDGRIQYAENPPKRYQDIYPFDFECEAWRALWQALYDVVRFWAATGVRWFRVDNPHTKPIGFWEWLIGGIRREFPEVLFLAEAFTKPTLMNELAKAGFSQSYTYFTWRNTGEELRAYVEELTRPPVATFLRPNFFVNTPDILPVSLQTGDRGVFLERLVLAATLSPSYGLYGPAFELQEHVPLTPGGEEYLHSEKYEIRHWDWDSPGSLAPEIRRLNEIRREHRAFAWSGSLHFHEVDSAELLVYSKRSPEGDDTVLTVVSLDPAYPVAGFVHLDMGVLGLSSDARFWVHDLMTGDRYIWTGPHNYVELRPGRFPAHIFEVVHLPRGRLPNELDFDPGR